MSKPGKVLKALCKKLGVRLTVKRGQKRVYKSVADLKRQCANKKKVKKKRKVKRRRKLRMGGVVGAFHQQNAVRARDRVDDAMNILGVRRNITSNMGVMNMNTAIRKFNRARDFIQQKMVIPGGIRKNLQGANLKGANLVNAELGANLKGANFQGANLDYCWITGADLRETNLDNAFSLHMVRYNNQTRFPVGFDPTTRELLPDFGRIKQMINVDNF